MSITKRDTGSFLIGFLVGATGVSPLTHLLYWLIIIGTALAFHFIR